MRASAGGLLKRALLGREREMWFVASLPFWISGLLLSMAGIIAPFSRRPGETNLELMSQFFIGIFLGGILLVIAAKIAS
jgi:hypothetical protein